MGGRSTRFTRGRSSGGGCATKKRLVRICSLGSRTEEHGHRSAHQPCSSQTCLTQTSKVTQAVFAYEAGDFNRR
jgi:hypothetical protein